MLLRTEAEYTVEQKKRIRILIKEGLDGITPRDTLPNDAFPLRGEAEAMYFKHARDFMRTSLAHKVMDLNQETYTEEKNGGRL